MQKKFELQFSNSLSRDMVHSTDCTNLQKLMFEISGHSHEFKLKLMKSWNF